nr:hypothetical protein BaRGS_031327 [Batillaria attramentaria]
MDAENEHFRFYTFMRLKLGDNGKKILQDLQAVFGAKCVALVKNLREAAPEMTAENAIHVISQEFLKDETDKEPSYLGNSHL